MPFTVSGKNAVLVTVATFETVSLHDDDPGETGDNEISGGGYARQTITWNAPAAGNLDSSNIPEFDVPISTVAWVGLWDGGTFQARAALAAPVVFAAPGVFRLLDADATLV